MKHHLTWFVLFLMATASVASAQQLYIESAEIRFEFPSKNVKGTIAGFESKSIIDWETPSNSLFKGSVAVSTLDTRNGLRNWHLRSSRYFAAKAHPKIQFESSSVAKTDNSLVVKGQLTLKGITKPLTIRFRKEEKRLIGTATIYSSDHDISIKKQREDNKVNITFDFVLK